MNTIALSPGSWICCILASVWQASLVSKAVTVKLKKSTQDSSSSRLDGEAKERVSAPHCGKTQCVGDVRPLPVHVECLLTELKHISLGWLKNFYWFPIGLSQEVFFEADVPYQVSCSNLSVCKLSVLLVNRFYLLSHFKEKHIEHSSFCETRECKGQRGRLHANQGSLASHWCSYGVTISEQVQPQLLFGSFSVNNRIHEGKCLCS